MNPCLGCGACCAAFRVDFHPAELAGGAFAWDEGVPVSLSMPVTPAIVRLRGTDDSPPRCVALSGEIGVLVACSLYAGRPSPCREFEAGSPACQRARRLHGLPALTEY